VTDRLNSDIILTSRLEKEYRLETLIAVLVFIGIAWLLGGGFGKMEKQIKGKKK